MHNSGLIDKSKFFHFNCSRLMRKEITINATGK